MKNLNARYITTEVPPGNPLPFVKCCANCVFAEPSNIDPSEIVCEVWRLRLKLENGCTQFMADKEAYYRFWRDSEETALHPSADSEADPLVNAVNFELQTESAREGDRAFGIAVGYAYKNRRLEDWEN